MRHPIKLIIYSTLIFLCLLIWGQSTWAVTPQQLKKLKGKEKGETTEAVQPPENIPSDQIDAFMATLSDEQVRRRLIEELKKRAEERPVSTEAGEPTYRGNRIQQIFDEADGQTLMISKRIRGIFRGSAAVLSQPRALIGILTDDKGTAGLLLTLVGLAAVIGAGLFAEWLLIRLSRDIHQQLLTAVPRGALQKLGNIFCRLLLDGLGVAIYILTTFGLFVIIYDKGKASYTIILTYLIIGYYFRAIVFLAGVVLSPSKPSLRLVPMADEDAVFLYRWFFRISLVAALIAGASIIVQNMGISEELYLLLYSAAGLSVFLLFIIMIWLSRHRVAQAICQDAADGTCDHSPLRAGFAKSWHIFAIFYVVFVGCFWQINALIAGKGKIIKLIASLFVIPIFIGIDQWGQRLLKAASGELPETIDLSGEDKEKEPDTDGEVTADFEPQVHEKAPMGQYVPFAKRLFRIVLVVGLFFVVLRLWGIDISITRVFSSTILSIIVALLLGLIVWEYSKTLIDRKLEEEFPDDDEEMEEGGAGGTRKGTLLLLLRKFVLAVLVVIVTMIVLSEMGIDIGPMIAGAGIAGLAIGFGAQTLVKDIISGVFFLIDDAFRVGDYVETAGQRGTVEHISIRSMRLRHHRGPVITVPFGDMNTVTNYSRDYHIMKLNIRVRYDTDVDKVRKIIKKINKQIHKDPELSAGLLDKIKSQGVREMDDSAMIMRIKFKTVPGQQFIVRKEVYKRVQEAFREAGIEFAHRNVTVYLPPETDSAESEEKSESKDKPATASDQKRREAAAAAALAITQEEEAQKGGGKAKDDR
ncbi:MAG: mechanosensitive ion channel family protein [Deltaproteobacteria bacterium]|nr:MAG: mechanosensitive ion channel family protein [Deltaproteobacteria bacterium]